MKFVLLFHYLKDFQHLLNIAILMINEDTRIEEARQAVLLTLQRIPELANIQVEPETWTEKYRADLLVSFRKQNDRKTLLVEIKSSGQPREARAAANSLIALLSSRPGTTYGVFVAPYISDASATICKENGIGYIDFGGNCWLHFDSIFMEIKGNPNRFSRKSELKSLFKPKAERILRALLHEPGRQWSTMELAEAVNVSPAQISNVRKLLLEREWIQDQKRGIKLTSPLPLLDSWLANYQSNRNAIYEFYDIGSVGEIEARIAADCNRMQTKYAFTGFSGTTRYAPFTTYKTVTVYMDNVGTTNLGDLPFKPVTSGANIRILSPYDEGVYYGTRIIGGQTVASAIQCYLDLKNEKARGEEAAGALLEQVIKPSWK